jgi:hypothetical protein
MDTTPLRLETGAEAAAYTTTFRVGRKYRVTVTIPPARQGEVRSAVFEWEGSRMTLLRFRGDHRLGHRLLALGHVLWWVEYG